MPHSIQQRLARIYYWNVLNALFTKQPDDVISDVTKPSVEVNESFTRESNPFISSVPRTLLKCPICACDRQHILFGVEPLPGFTVILKVFTSVCRKCLHVDARHVKKQRSFPIGDIGTATSLGSPG